MKVILFFSFFLTFLTGVPDFVKILSLFCFECMCKNHYYKFFLKTNYCHSEIFVTVSNLARTPPLQLGLTGSNLLL